MAKPRMTKVGPSCRRRRQPIRSSLTVAALAAVGALVLGGTGGEALQRSDDTGVATTPLLSARRVPVLVQSLAKGPALAQELALVTQASPSQSCLDVSVAGRSLFAHRADQALIPASNQKVVTAKLALDVLGAGYRYRTVVAGDLGDDGVVDGDLYLVGGGDPVLRTKQYDDYFGAAAGTGTSIEDIADAVVAKGVRHVTGAIVGDESRYDSERDVPGWPDRYLDQHQLGPLSALAVNQGFTSFPDTYSEEGLADLQAAANPPLAAAEMFAALLRERGVRIDAPATTGNRPAAAPTVATGTSPPLTQIVAQLLNRSDNQISELLVKEAGKVQGASGTTAAGLEVFHETFGRLGLPEKGVKMVDGSGLSYDNRLTCALLEALLHRTGPNSVIAKGLAVGGETGTLRERFRNPATKGRIRAKTGTLNDVSSLSGFALADGTPGLVFSYIANGVPVTAELLDVQERLGRILVSYADGLPLSKLQPR